jgi:hypothetical protein
MDQITPILKSVVCVIPKLIQNKTSNFLEQLTETINSVDIKKDKEKISLLFVRFASDFGRDMGKVIRSLLSDFTPLAVIFTVQKLINLFSTINNYKDLIKRINEDNFMDILNGIDKKTNSKFGIILETFKSSVIVFAKLIMNYFVKSLFNVLDKTTTQQESTNIFPGFFCSEDKNEKDQINDKNMVKNIPNEIIITIKEIITNNLQVGLDNFANSFFNSVVDVNKEIRQNGGKELKNLQKIKNVILTRINKDINNLHNTTHNPIKYIKSIKSNNKYNKYNKTSRHK